MFSIVKFITRIKLFFLATLVGMDEYGNKYFELKNADYLGRKRRVCLFHGIVEASKIPAHWHAWMHYSSKEVIEYSKRFWMKSHVPDLTGTLHAFMPNVHSQFNIYGARAIKKISSYEAWNGKLSN